MRKCLFVGGLREFTTWRQFTKVLMTRKNHLKMQNHGLQCWVGYGFFGVKIESFFGESFDGKFWKAFNCQMCENIVDCASTVTSRLHLVTARKALSVVQHHATSENCWFTEWQTTWRHESGKLVSESKVCWRFPCVGKALILHKIIAFLRSGWLGKILEILLSSWCF